MQKYSALFCLGVVCVSFLMVMTMSIAEAQTIRFSDLLTRQPPVATQRLAYGDDPDQFGDLWLPSGSGPHPVLIMIHGGCWQASLPGVVLMSFIADDMRKNGFAVWNIEYRRLGHHGGGYPGTFLDIAKGIDYLRSIRATYHLDISHLTIVGHSAGGQLALWAAARNQIKPDSAVYTADPLPIESVTTLAGINDLKAYRDNGPDACGGPRTIDELINAQSRSDQNPYADTSPATMLPLHVRQFIVSGALDPIVPARFGIDYAALADAKGDAVTTLTIPDAGHFEFIDPTSNAWAQIKKTILSKMQQ